MQQEENNMLKIQNEDLSAKLRRSEVILSRVKEELARFRASTGKNPYTNYDEEQRLSIKLKVSKRAHTTHLEKERCGGYAQPITRVERLNSQLDLPQETEEEKVQLAHKLLGLCTSVLKVCEK
jgi:kinesin family protein 15